MIVCFDTCVLIWGIQGQASPEYSAKVGQTRALLNQLEQSKAKIIVPAPVAFELLLPVHPERHGVVLETLNQRFRIVPYDTAAAAKNAEIWQKKQGRLNGGISEFRSEWPSATKSELRFDCQIVAIASLYGAEVLFSEDAHVRAFAEGVVNVQPVPSAVEQSRLF